MSRGIALWEIAGEVVELFEKVEQQGGELTDELEEQLDSLNLEAETKLENLACYIQNLEAEGKAIVDTASKAVARGRSRLAKAKRLRAYMALNMDAIGQDRVDTDRVSVKLKNSQPKIEWSGEVDDIPPQFQRHTIALDKSKAKASLKEEGELPEGFVITQGKHISL